VETSGSLVVPPILRPEDVSTEAKSSFSFSACCVVGSVGRVKDVDVRSIGCRADVVRFYMSSSILHSSEEDR
jgi:hypothetical protein